MERRPGEGPGGSPYAGKPRPGLDQAWHDLLKYSNIRLSLEELDFLDPARKDSAVELPDGGYYATTQVMHELHCIVGLYLTYFPELSTAQLEDQKIHVEHCLDTLRQGVMCRADLTPITMRWGHKQPVPLGNFSSPHQCVDWSRVDYWMQDRSIDDIFRPGYLQHPVLGEVYTEENQENAEITGTVHDD
ncbi:uncharacterized protein K489DRAFT_320844 [Dissoconium aciculare CBS 342.82]|uniref:Tat pathway signal sequence n=1 Tax=Dissoconium aciculare CBS 342.82 TaxID=1314786 RepID=A0A6J3M6Q3_9PEZI|nr:uncharacterized protein K489DRAFT_320844 [Dissoconium aciculare CBS 342.82]KAF1822547.1 hypothetical protein K489DRAFT_320844 [Dissoconium aciculare CBS 342.82]